MIAGIFLLLTLLFSSCNNEEESTEAKTPEKVTDLYEVNVTLPPAEGVKLVEANCVACHSLRYIEMQPDMPKASWEKIVKKMVATYGAPINDTNTVHQIVDYLAAVKGKK